MDMEFGGLVLQKPAAPTAAPKGKRWAWVTRLGERLREERGTAAVTFLLSLPVFLTIVAVMVQLALLVNAKILIHHAAFMAGRAAVTCLPEQRFAEIDRAARMALTPLSPVAGGDVDPEGLSMQDALRNAGVDVAETFAARYSYAMAATTVRYPNPGPPDFYLTHHGQPIEVTVTYRFYLTVPVAKMFIAPLADTVGGINGRFLTMSATCPVQTAHGRQAVTGNNGWPQ